MHVLGVLIVEEIKEKEHLVTLFYPFFMSSVPDTSCVIATNETHVTRGVCAAAAE